MGKRRDLKTVRRFLNESVHLGGSPHPPGHHAWSTFRQTKVSGQMVPDFRYCPGCDTIELLDP